MQGIRYKILYKVSQKKTLCCGPLNLIYKNVSKTKSIGSHSKIKIPLIPTCSRCRALVMTVVTRRIHNLHLVNQSKYKINIS